MFLGIVSAACFFFFIFPPPLQAFYPASICDKKLYFNQRGFSLTGSHRHDKTNIRELKLLSHGRSWGLFFGGLLKSYKTYKVYLFKIWPFWNDKTKLWYWVVTDDCKDPKSLHSLNFSTYLSWLYVFFFLKKP